MTSRPSDDPAPHPSPGPVRGLVVAVGPAVTDALAAVVDELKGGDPLRPVTVVVPSNYVAVSARRALVTRRGSLAAVSFLTTYRLAELLAAPRLAAAGRRPVSTPVLAAAIRAALGADPGVFAGVAEHPSTERALIGAYRELADVPAGLHAAVAARSRRAADVVRIVGEVRTALTPRWYDEADLVAEATAVATGGDSDPVLAQLGDVVVHVPERVSEPSAALLRALADGRRVEVVAAATGHSDPDAAVRASLDRLGVAWSPPPPVRPAAGRVVSVSDPEEEVRVVTREILDAARAGEPADRMAVLYASDDPYRRLLHEHLRAAGVTFNGSSVRSVAEGVLGRTLLEVVRLADRDWRREDVMAVFSRGLVTDLDGSPVPAAAWERISRAAGVVSGGDWEQRLRRHGEDLDARIASLDADGDDEGRARGLRREAAATRELRATVADLARRLAPAGPALTWAGLVDTVRTLVEDRLGGGVRDGWPPEERAMADRVEAALDRLAVLDPIDPSPSLDGFARALSAELDSGLGRVGRLGEGVFVAPVTMSWGVDVDRVWFVGMAEGLMPSRPREDALLPDRERLAAGGHLRVGRDRLDGEHRALLAAACGASSVVMTHPRGDLRRTADRTPSRWLLDAVSACEGAGIDAGTLTRSDGPDLVHVASFVGGLSAVQWPASAHEYDLCRLLAATERGDDPTSTDVFGSPRLRRQLDLVRARAGRSFTRFDGNLAGVGVPSPFDEGQVVSPTRLEAWAACPHHYLLRHLLRVEPVEDPEREMRISPLERGRLVHAVLDRWLAEIIASPAGPPGPTRRWSPHQRARLHAVLDEECDAAEAHGLVGRALFWEVDRRVLHREVDRFCDEDDERRAARGSVPVRTELHFGRDPDDAAGLGPVAYPLSDGRVLWFRGSADRIDRAGNVWVVIDYKTGSARRYGGLGQADPHVGGTRLQLPVYAQATRTAMGDSDGAVVAAYWFVSGAGKWQWKELELDEVAMARVDEALRTIADGIASGVFVARAEPPGYGGRRVCPSCSPDGLGTADRLRELERKAEDPALGPWLALAGPDLTVGSDR